MICRHSKLTCNTLKYFAIFCLLLGSTTACEKSASPDQIEENNTTEYLSVEPSGPIDVGIFESVPFTVRLQDHRGRPIAGAPITATFTNDAYNASLTPYQSLTDVDGEGEITFIAPSRITADTTTQNQPNKRQLEIRFQSPYHEVYVPITVDPGSVKLTIDIAYDGTRIIDTVKAQLFETESDSELQSVEVLSQNWPIHLDFPGLIEGTQYRLEIFGKNDSEIRARGTADNLSPNTEYDPIALIDSELEIKGMFDITTHLQTEDKLVWTVDALFNDIQALDSPAEAILDAIDEELSDDPFASTSFDDEREAQELDQRLTDRLAEAIVKLEGEFKEIKETMRASLSDLTFIGTAEIGRPNEDLLFYHLIELISFGPPDLEIPLQFGIESPDKANGNIELGERDTLIIDEHLINLGLGAPLKEALLKNTLLERLGVSSIDKALENHIDCTEVADFLGPYLSDVAIRETIEWGCNNALLAASQQIAANADALNKEATLELSGTCRLDIPESGNQIKKFSDGTFSILWVFNSNETTRIDATFEATLKEN